MSAEQELRESVQRDIRRHLAIDPFRASYVAEFTIREAPLALLEKLIDELDATYPEHRP